IKHDIEVLRDHRAPHREFLMAAEVADSTHLDVVVPIGNVSKHAEGSALVIRALRSILGGLPYGGLGREVDQLQQSLTIERSAMALGKHSEDQYTGVGSGAVGSRGCNLISMRALTIEHVASHLSDGV